MNIKGNTFFISGGASGLGLATTEMILANGGKAVIADINEEAGNNAQSSLGENVLFVKTDVSDENSVQDAINKGIRQYGQINGAISCAGIGSGEKTLGKNGVHRLKTFQKVISVNLIGTFNVVRLSAESISRNDPGEGGERGVIINTASVAAFDGQIGQAAYSASKAGIAGMTLPIARDLARTGIRVLTIAPGIFETPLLMGLSDELKASLGAQVPFPPRLGQPREFAQLVQQMIENQMLNGEVIRLDGAIRMAPR